MANIAMAIAPVLLSVVMVLPMTFPYSRLVQAPSLTKRPSNSDIVNLDEFFVLQREILLDFSRKLVRSRLWNLQSESIFRSVKTVFSRDLTLRVSTIRRQQRYTSACDCAHDNALLSSMALFTDVIALIRSHSAVHGL
jgi:hypothetical protein